MSGNNLSKEFLRTIDKDVNDFAHRLARLIKKNKISKTEIDFFCKSALDVGYTIDQVERIKAFIIKNKKEKEKLCSLL